MRQATFTTFGYLASGTPVTSSVRLGTLIQELSAQGYTFCANFTNWFGVDLEQPPFEKPYMRHCQVKKRYTHEQICKKTAVFATRKANIMQILLCLKNAGKLLADGKTALAFPQEKYKGKECQIVFYGRRVNLEAFDPNAILLEGSEFIFASDKKELPEDLFEDVSENSVKLLKSESLT